MGAHNSWLKCLSELPDRTTTSYGPCILVTGRLVGYPSTGRLIGCNSKAWTVQKQNYICAQVRAGGGANLALEPKWHYAILVFMKFDNGQILGFKQIFVNKETK